MRFSTISTLSALVALAAAQNPFTRTSYTGIAAGVPLNITWTPSTPGTISLLLRQGDPNALTTVGTIASAIPNSGSFVWTPSAQIVKGSNYALEIVSDSNANIFNYSPQFAIDSTNTVSASTTGSSSTAASSSTGSTSGSATTTGSSTTGSASSTGSTTSGSTSSRATTTTGSSTGSSSAAAATTTTSSSRAAAPTNGVKLGAGVLGFVGMAMMAL